MGKIILGWKALWAVLGFIKKVQNDVDARFSDAEALSDRLWTEALLEALATEDELTIARLRKKNILAALVVWGITHLPKTARARLLRYGQIYFKSSKLDRLQNGSAEEVQAVRQAFHGI